MSRLELIIGSMFSGKTSELIRRLNIEHGVKKKKVVFVNSQIDDRSATAHSTHNQTLTKQLPFDTIKTVSLMTVLSQLVKYDVVGIDESHFFDDLEITVKTLHNRGDTDIMIVGLNGDSERKEFGQIIRLIPIATDLVLRKAVCIECHKHNATYSHRMPCKTTEESGQKVVGGKEKYKAVCFECRPTEKREETPKDV